MARITSLIKFVGSLGGELTGANYKGTSVLRKKIVTSSQPNTQKQLEQRLRFKLVGNVLKDVSAYLRISFSEAAKGASSGYNVALSCNLKNDAVSGIYPDLQINYSKLQMAKGTLYGEDAMQVSRFDDRLEFSWTDNSGNGNAVATDVAMPLVYNKTKEVWLYVTEGEMRGNKRMVMHFPPSWKTDSFEAWMSFRSDDGKKIADSMYLQVV